MAADRYFSDIGPDVTKMYSCDWMAAGNIVTFYNQTNFKERSYRSVAELKVYSVLFEDVEYPILENVGSVSVATKYGEIVFFRSGFYSYYSKQAAPKADQSERVEVILVGASGQRELVQLRVQVVVAPETQNQMADYGGQIARSKLELQRGFFRSKEIPVGAMIFGYDRNDRFLGSQGDDSFAAWLGKDLIQGLDGDDLLMGEQDSNVLTGGAGSDHFLLHIDKSYDDARFDTITDFSLADGDAVSMKSVLLGESALDNYALVQFRVQDEYLDVLVPRRNPDLNGFNDDNVLALRILSNPNFDPQSVLPSVLVREGYLQF